MKRSRTGLVIVATLSLCATAGIRRAAAQGQFVRGDANLDDAVNLTDAVFILRALFVGGSQPACRDAADTNDTGNIDLSDGIFLLNALFRGGRSVPPPNHFELDPTPDDLTCIPNGAIEELTGDITTDTVLRRGVYRLVSQVRVVAGVTLRIEAGSTLLGDSASQGLLVVARGGRLVARGTEQSPIVFTSDKPFGERRRGDWGGLIILGRGDNNVPGKEALAEGLENELWGGGANVIPDDDSGSLSYVRVEYGGTEISPDNEVNAISLFGVGSGTQLDHIQVKFNLDDGVEWFGGNCSLKYALATAIGDDSFDYSFGWSGNGQFWVAQQRGDDADRGFEVDNSESEFGAEPLTRPALANVTLVGDPDDNEGTESTTGITFRRGCGSVLYNFVISGFKGAAMDIDDGVTTNHSPGNGELVADYGVFYQNGGGTCQTGETGGNQENAANGFAYTTCEFVNTLNAHNVDAATAPIVDPYNLPAPNFRPQNDAATAGFDATSLGSFFEPAAYKGGVAPEGAGADWTQARWISFEQG